MESMEGVVRRAMHGSAKTVSPWNPDGCYIGGHVRYMFGTCSVQVGHPPPTPSIDGGLWVIPWVYRWFSLVYQRGSRWFISWFSAGLSAGLSAGRGQKI